MLVLSSFSITSSIQANTNDPLDGKTEEEVEKEINEYFEKVYEEEQKNKESNNVQTYAVSDNQTKCMGQYMGNQYSEILKDSTVLALLDKDKITMDDIKTSLKNAFKNLPNATIVGFSYQFYKAHQACHNIE
jgi:predicted Zn-dependent peptidase